MKAGEKQKTGLKQDGRSLAIVPVLLRVITCPGCGAGVDLWADDEETACFACNYVVFQKQSVLH